MFVVLRKSVAEIKIKEQLRRLSQESESSNEGRPTGKLYRVLQARRVLVHSRVDWSSDPRFIRSLIASVHSVLAKHPRTVQHSPLQFRRLGPNALRERNPWHPDLVLVPWELPRVKARDANLVRDATNRWQEPETRPQPTIRVSLLRRHPEVGQKSHNDIREPQVHQHQRPLLHSEFKVAPEAHKVLNRLKRERSWGQVYLHSAIQLARLHQGRYEDVPAQGRNPSPDCLPLLVDAHLSTAWECDGNSFYILASLRQPSRKF